MNKRTVSTLYWSSLAAFLVYGVLFTMVAGSLSVTMIDEVTSGSKSELIRVIGSYTTVDINFYLKVIQPLDYIFALLYTLLFITALCHFIGVTLSKVWKKNFWFLLSLPLITFCLDVAENLIIRKVLLDDHKSLEGVGGALQFVGLMKFGLSSIWMLLTLIYTLFIIGRMLYQRLFKK